jgi:hypothetical protein
MRPFTETRIVLLRSEPLYSRSWCPSTQNTPSGQQMKIAKGDSNCGPGPSPCPAQAQPTAHGLRAPPAELSPPSGSRQHSNESDRSAGLGELLGVSQPGSSCRALQWPVPAGRWAAVGRVRRRLSARLLFQIGLPHEPQHQCHAHPQHDRGPLHPNPAGPAPPTVGPTGQPEPGSWAQVDMISRSPRHFLFCTDLL